MKQFLTKNIIPVIIVTILSLMTIGYALYDQPVNLNGNVTIQKAGIIEITSANIVRNECSNLTSYNEPTYEGMHIEFVINTRSTSFSATYLITITNNSTRDYTYTGFPVNASIEGYDYVPNITTKITRADTGAEVETGEIIESGESITVKLKMDFQVDRNQSGLTIIVNGNAAASEDNSGSLTANITPKTGDLRGDDTLAPFQLSVINTFKYNRTFSLTSSNENIIIVDDKGNAQTHFSVGANATATYTIYLKVKEGSIFLTDQTTTNIILSSNMIDNIDLGTITLDVDKDINATDHEKPEVGNVKIQISENNPVNGEAIVSWSRIDTGGSPIVNYYIELYNETTGEQTNYETGNAITSYTIPGLSVGTYYAKVYGEDEAGNSGAEDCNSATTANGYCSQSESTYLQWIFNVTSNNLERLNLDGNSTAMIYSSYEATLNVDGGGFWGGYTLPNSITITMGGKTLTSGTDYTYDSSTGRIVINRVTGDIDIAGRAGSTVCLIEGTKVRLANGKTKNIEDINYDDLLMVYDHENGGITYEYPAWIETAKKTKTYQKTTFSDGTVLKTYGPHGVFSKDLLKYVSVTDRSEFYVGSHIVKISKNGKPKTVTVTKIETVNKNTKYYHITSTRYHNIIADDILTTDGTVVSSFLFNFNEDLTWGSKRDEFLKQNDLFEYQDLAAYFPRHVFVGFRMSEAKNVYNQGLLDIEYFADLLSLDNAKKPIKNNQGENVWMVTTSDNKVTKKNKEKFLKEEGSYYTLKEPQNSQNFVGWLNTVDNKIYQPNDKVEVVCGTHFVAQYK